MNRNGQTRILLGICLALAAGTVLLYWPVRQHDFINLDDPTYVLQNPKVSQGVTGKGIAWAFQSFYGANWHPLTWISHMVDVQFYGMRPTGHHGMSVGLHIANAILLLLLLNQITRAVWRSALVAALFAWHPAHVESVAWIAERKDVLSTFFGLLALLAYARYAGQFHVPCSTFQFPGTARSAGLRFLRSGWYWAALLLLALGLMSKPMLVTWPFVLLLLDWWPLGRMQPSAASGQQSTVSSPKPESGWSIREQSTLRSLILEKIPFFLLAAGSCVLTFLAQRAGGAVQSMNALPLSARVENAVVSYARYLGKSLWPAELNAFYPHPVEWPAGVVLGAASLIAVLLGLALWRSRTNGYFLTGFGWFLGTLVPVIGLVQVGGQSIADRYLYIPQIGIWIALVWGGAELVGSNLGRRRLATGMSVIGLVAAGLVTRNYLPAWQNSVTLFRHTLKIDEKNPPALYSLGLALCSDGKVDEAIPYLERAAALDSNIQIYQGQLALAYELKGDTAGAIARYRRCVELAPDLTEALNNLAWLLATAPKPEHRNGAEAIKHATRACELTQHDWPMFLGTLAASYAEAGRFPEAIQTAEKAEAMARRRGLADLAARNAELLKEYRAGKPHRE